MRRFVLLLLATAAVVVAGAMAFDLAMDPYDVLGGPRWKGVNQVKTRRISDGRRVIVGFSVLKPRRTLYAGDSRVWDGFGETPPPWGGSWFNAGMPSGNAFELGRALALQARAGVDCVVLGLDAQDYDQVSKIKGAFWLSPLLDGSAPMATLRMAASKTTFGRALDTWRDNANRRWRPGEWPLVYAPGGQLAIFRATAEEYEERFQAYAYDPERVRFIASIVERMTERGVQLIGVFTPLHAVGTEAVFRGGGAGALFRFRRDIAGALGAFAARRPRAPCVPGGAVVLWDFWGDQPFSTPPLPGAQETRAHPDFYDAAHFTPRIGAEMLRRMAGLAPREAFAKTAPFGVRVDAASLAAADAAILARRAAWLRTPQGREASAFFDQAERRAAPLPVGERFYLSRDDWRRLDRDLPKLGR
jgi:hypothetical protein